MKNILNNCTDIEKWWLKNELEKHKFHCIQFQRLEFIIIRKIFSYLDIKQNAYLSIVFSLFNVRYVKHLKNM